MKSKWQQLHLGNIVMATFSFIGCLLLEQNPSHKK